MSDVNELGRAFLGELLKPKRKPKAARGKVDDVRVQTTPAIEPEIRVKPWGKEPPLTLSNGSTIALSGENEKVISSPHVSIVVFDWPVKDFDTGEIVDRFSYLPHDLKPCAGCGLAASYHDHQYGFRICISCDPDEIAAAISRDVLTAGGLF